MTSNLKDFLEIFMIILLFPIWGTIFYFIGVMLASVAAFLFGIVLAPIVCFYYVIKGLFS